MKTLKLMAVACVVIILFALGSWLFFHKNTLIWHKVLHTGGFDTVSIAYPLLGARKQAMVFVDTKKYPPVKLAEQIARLGAEAAIVDTDQAFKGLSIGGQQCLDTAQVVASVTALAQEVGLSAPQDLIVAGIGDGALLPFLRADAPSGQNSTNLSVDFSANLPDSLNVCPPVSTSTNEKQYTLTSAPGLVGTWQSVWSDQPASETAVFVKGLKEVKTSIAQYDTAKDAILVGELQKLIDPSGSPAVPLAVVEVPAATASDTVTIFYSGDGGWRDLDRIIAEEMAKLGYPVVGVDTLRSFWTRKTPEQATDDLVKTMDYYRKAWGAKSFVLAGYSFGAEILPPMYNRLPAGAKESVRLLVLLAISREIDFEIQVSGWLGQNTGELPMAPELLRLPKNKVLCMYGEKEKDDSACTDMAQTEAELLELPGGHHFDHDYPKLTRLILERYTKAGILRSPPVTQRQ